MTRAELIHSLRLEYHDSDEATPLLDDEQLERAVDRAMVSVNNGCRGYAVSGTPADCVKLGITEIIGRRPDAVIAGINPGANVHLLPVVAGFVGADAVADALAAGLGEDGRARLMLDLGTNAEMMLSAGGRIWACAAAAGPAFEGARISCGMRAAPGAIARVEIAGGRVRVSGP